MFKLFNRNNDGDIKVKDLVWISSGAKWEAMLREPKNTSFIFWFEKSMQLAQDYFTGNNADPSNFYLANAAHSRLFTGSPVIFAEHYPLKSKEQQLFKDLQLHSATIFSSLDEAIFRHFGSDKIVNMVRQLGMKESEAITHSMISNAIENAQSKLEREIKTEYLASSQMEWFEKNFPA